MDSPAPMVRELANDLLGHVERIGLDLVDVQVLTDLIIDGGQPFLDTCWTAAEQAAATQDPERLAGRWAAKEAIMKCLGAGIGNVEPTDIEILTLPSGAPTVVLRGEAAAIADDRNLHGWKISISHESGWAAAIAVTHQQPACPPSPQSGGPNGGDRNA